MARGFLSGILWGGVVGLGVTGVASVLAPLPVGPVVSDAAPDAAQAPARVVQATSGESASATDRAPVTGQVAPQSQVPEADGVSGLEPETLASAVQPQTGVVDGLQAPAEGAVSADLSVDAETPVVAAPQAVAPIAPQSETLAINTQPAAPPPPTKEQVAGGFDDPAQPAAQNGTETAQTAITSAPAQAVVAAATPRAPQAPAAIGNAPELAGSTTPAPRAEVAQNTDEPEAVKLVPLEIPAAVRNILLDRTRIDTGVQTVSVPGADVVPQVAQETVAKDVAQDVVAQAGQANVSAPVKTASLETQANATPEVRVSQGAADVLESDEITSEETATNVVTAQAPSAEPAVTTPSDTAEVEFAQVDRTQADVGPEDTAERPTAQALPTQRSGIVRRALGTPSTTLTDRNNGVIVNRLAGEETTPEEEVQVANEVSVDTSHAPAIQKYAQAFENASGKPLMSIVLIDDGSSIVSGAEGIAALRSFPYPLSFAVDTNLKDAAERMAIYRGEGLEVMALVDLPEGALPSDAETALGVILPKMDGVVGVLEGTKGGLQGSRDVSDQVTAILAQSGLGLLTQDKGLNTMPKLARKEGVPAEPIFRDFDSKDQTARVIRRFLDQAAFKAGQEGAVVMLGRLRPDTVSALLLWGLQDRAGKVALAPISAVLTREQ